MDLERKLAGGLTVGEMITHLSRYAKDAYVVFEHDYGDRTHTMQALPVKNVESMNDEGAYLYETAYSASGLALRREDDKYHDPDAAPPLSAGVIILTS